LRAHRVKASRRAVSLKPDEKLDQSQKSKFAGSSVSAPICVKKWRIAVAVDNGTMAAWFVTSI
jgi:hypothetical protein